MTIKFYHEIPFGRYCRVTFIFWFAVLEAFAALEPEWKREGARRVFAITAGKTSLAYISLRAACRLG